MTLLPGYPAFSGLHDGFRALANVAGQSGFVDQRNRRPFSEAMWLGLAGGLGCGYILWEFKALQSAVLTLGFSYRWNYPKEVLRQVVARVGAEPCTYESGGQKAAAKKLASLHEQGIAPLALVDPYFLPHRGVPDHCEGCGGARVVICGREGDDWLVHDGGLFLVPDAALQAARRRIGSYKHFLLWFGPLREPYDLHHAVLEGVRDHVAHLQRNSLSFSIGAVAKWAKLMTHEKDAKGWRRVFAQGNGLYSALVSLYRGVEIDSQGGLRGLYADFLAEAAELVAPLDAAVTPYREAQACWRRLAEHALAALPETQNLLVQRREALNGGDVHALAEINHALESLRVGYDGVFREPAGLFEQLQDDLNAIVSAETAALKVLAEAVHGH